jgi:DNA-binding response OmpR family regulator
VLRQRGLEVETCSDGFEQFDAGKVDGFDVVVLNRTLRATDGIELCRELRACGCTASLVVFTQHDDEQAEIAAFRAGADDFVTKSSNADALTERVLANARRARSYPPHSGKLRRFVKTRAGTLAVSQGPLIVLNGLPLDLPRLQGRLLQTLLEASGPVSTAALAEAAWNGERVAEHTVHSQIALLRARLAELGARVEHVRGQGYVVLGCFESPAAKE